MGTNERDRDEKGKTNIDRDGKDNDKHEERFQNGGVVIKSCPTKPTRITLRGTKNKPVEPSRPPWNTGSPSPTSTKAQATRSIRSLPTKLPNRPKVQRQEEPQQNSTLTDIHPGASKAEQLTPCTSPEPTNFIIPTEDSETGLEWGYRQMEEFLQHATGTATATRAKDPCAASPIPQSSWSLKNRSVEQLSTDVELQEDRRKELTAAADIAVQTEVLKRAIKLHQPPRDQPQEESFGDSDVMTSPRLKIPFSWPTLTPNQPSPLETAQSPRNFTPKTNEQASLEDKLASDRRRAFILAIFSQDELIRRSLIRGQVRSDPLLELDQESPDDVNSAPQRRKESVPTVAKTQSSSSRGLPFCNLEIDQKASDDEPSAPRPAAQPIPSMTRTPYPRSRALPAIQLLFGPDASDDEQTAHHRMKQPTPSMVKAQRTIARRWPISTLQFDLETSDGEQARHQLAARPKVKFECHGHRVWPISQPRLDLELAEERDFGRRGATLPLTPAKLHQHCSIDEQVTSLRPLQPAHMVPRAEHPAHRISKPAWAQIASSDSHFYADGESTEEDYETTSRSIINLSRRLRQSRSRSSVKSVKWDPAIIACGPITVTQEPPPKAKANESSEVSKAASKKDGMEENLETFSKTISQWKKGDRKVIQKFLKALKTLDSDEESTTKAKPASKKEPKQSKTIPKTAPGKGLNPLAPVFRDFLTQKPEDDNSREISFLSVSSKRLQSPEDNQEDPFIAKDTIQTCKPIPRAIRLSPAHRNPDLRKQEPIWINTLQPPPYKIPAENQEDEDFREFCRANNFIPIVPVKQNPIIPIARPEPITPILPPYVPFLLDPFSNSYRLSFEGTKPSLQTIPTRLAPPAEKVLGAPFTGPVPTTKQTADQEFTFTLEETSEPIEDEGSRVAKALDPAWGAQILDNFVKRYPMTGQRKEEAPVCRQNENQRPAAKDQAKQRPKVEGKAGGVKANITRATEIQQKLEMMLLLQKERKAPLVPDHKIKATEIQQKLEIMLYKLKEQKALEGFSNRVSKRAERSSEKHSEKDAYSSRSASKSSKGTADHVGKLR